MSPISLAEIYKEELKKVENNMAGMLEAELHTLSRAILELEKRVQKLETKLEGNGQ